MWTDWEEIQERTNNRNKELKKQREMRALEKRIREEMSLQSSLGLHRFLSSLDKKGGK